MSHEREKDRAGLEMRINVSGFTLWMTNWMKLPVIEIIRLMGAWDLDSKSLKMRCDDGRVVDLNKDEAERLSQILDAGEVDEWIARHYLMAIELHKPRSSWMIHHLPELTGRMLKHKMDRDMKRVQELMDK